ncbi:MAG: hypothetical protein AB2A00_08590 [Myxococcota bacterium]
MTASIRAISRVGNATTAALRRTDSIGAGGPAARVAGCVAGAGSAVRMQGNVTRTEGPSFSTVMAATGGGPDLEMQRALQYHVEVRTWECQQNLAAQRSAAQERHTADLRGRLDHALVHGLSVPVTSGVGTLPAGIRGLLPPHLPQLDG